MLVQTEMQIKINHLPICFLWRNFYLNQRGVWSESQLQWEHRADQTVTGMLSLTVRKAVTKNLYLTVLTITLINMVTLIYWSSGIFGNTEIFSLASCLSHCFADSSINDTPDNSRRLKEESDDNVEMCSVIP